MKESLDALRATQQQLVQSEKLRAAGQLASGGAHNQNNALAVILGHAELALRLSNQTAVQASPEQIRLAAEAGAVHQATPHRADRR